MTYLNKYLEKVKAFLDNFNQFDLERIPRLENDHVDALAKLACIKAPSKNWLLIQSVMLAPSIEKIYVSIERSVG